jgi:3alpha(or 20beta)-hydroxysteroid dehydrogenase
METDFAGKLIVVTGAARGQGAAEVELLVSRGATVIATDILDQDGKELIAKIKGPGSAQYRHLDVTKETDWNSLHDELKGQELFGLVNNAGAPIRARFPNVSKSDFEKAIEINLTSALIGSQALLPLMSKGASIVNVGSVAALTAHTAISYTAAKWGLRGLTKAMALELSEREIRVNIVHPGLIDTPLLDGASDGFVSAHLAQTPAGRIGTALEVAEMVVFLLSSSASYINGGEFTVDGGFSAHGGTMSIRKAISD